MLLLNLVDQLGEADEELAGNYAELGDWCAQRILQHFQVGDVSGGWEADAGRQDGSRGAGEQGTPAPHPLQHLLGSRPTTATPAGRRWSPLRMRRHGGQGSAGPYTLGKEEGPGELGWGGGAKGRREGAGAPGVLEGAGDPARSNSFQASVCSRTATLVVVAGYPAWRWSDLAGAWRMNFRKVWEMHLANCHYQGVNFSNSRRIWNSVSECYCYYNFVVHFHPPTVRAGLPRQGPWS